jgi:hypothetical protein
MFQIRLFGVSFFLVLVCAALLASAPARETLRAQGERGQRLRPPATLNCSRNELTSFTGRVLSYSRGKNSLFIRVRTDEQTTESFTLNYGRRDDPTRWFLLRAEPFKAADWSLIEARRGRLRPLMRATVWVCSNSRKPVIDWQPPER